MLLFIPILVQKASDLMFFAFLLLFSRNNSLQNPIHHGHDRDGLGSEENYFWKTAKERQKTTDRKPFEPELG